MSRRTVSRAILEGGIAAEIQIGHELTQVKAFTGSGDGTSNKHISYDARHVHYKVSGLRCSRFLGLHSSVDQSSEQEVEDWEDILADTLKMFQKSPLGKRSKTFDHVLDLMLKWMGMNTDHCSKAKKTSRLISEKKTIPLSPPTHS
ncbi:hypothetical protein PILCRDRAFT_7289 [Piloderma croceum F 1598]|uniref:Uncharacterized protein n=1 Tax=Piloderma croceum (strain F 1598) TaxID=765440 RepID=A0A0C3BAN7_PILCF|nr:hypothetical protein PILCRDRAFT_7289 [Piloderma croceum F 1598]